MRYIANTPIKFFKEANEYVPGVGSESGWKEVTSKAAGGNVSVYFCEWIGTFGDQALSAQAMGVSESARIRMPYNPDVYSALQSSRVIVVKNADPNVIKNGAPDKSNPNAYELWGGVDNVKNQNLEMEFRVRRYEGK